MNFVTRELTDSVDDKELAVTRGGNWDDVCAFGQ
jgi:hypothetical protein